ncbi:MAG: ferrous iron transport protein A [Lachnospiraceae bacterium]|jgi:Fe2+ transport system protein FeoA|nr:ferrous iron transport protein A [Lachnospiraceae bacterium]
MVLPLSYAKSGQHLRIVWIASEPCMKQKLALAGFRPNETLYCILKPVSRGMGAYRIHGSLIALRWENIKEIFVEEFLLS